MANDPLGFYALFLASIAGVLIVTVVARRAFQRKQFRDSGKLQTTKAQASARGFEQGFNEGKAYGIALGKAMQQDEDEILDLVSVGIEQIEELLEDLS